MNVMVNRLAQRCHFCGAVVPANGGRMWRFKGRYYVAHLNCHASGKAEAEVVEFRLSSGTTIRQNKNGVCEDAPCCGCCGTTEGDWR